MDITFVRCTEKVGYFHRVRDANPHAMDAEAGSVIEETAMRHVYVDPPYDKIYFIEIGDPDHKSFNDDTDFESCPLHNQNFFSG